MARLCQPDAWASGPRTLILKGGFCEAGLSRRGRALGQIDFGNMLRNLSRIRLGQIGQDHHGQLVIHVTRNLGLEALPCAFVIDEAMSV